MTEGHIVKSPSRRSLFIVVIASLVAAAAILLGAILPAEYHVDPLGIGRATGLLNLSRPKEVSIALPMNAAANSVAHFYSTEFRADTVDIPLTAGGDLTGGDEREWKVRMQVGDTVVYSWSVAAPPDEFYFDFHGQSDPNPEVNVLSYKEGLGIASNGSMVAPFDGIHGWYLQNQSEKPVVVHLKLSGFYQMRADPYAPE
jgi:hypothetical protein